MGKTRKNKTKMSKFIIIKGDGTDFYKNSETKDMIILDDYEFACSMLSMMEIDGYVCEIKHHYKESELQRKHERRINKMKNK